MDWVVLILGFAFLAGAGLASWRWMLAASADGDSMGLALAMAVVGPVAVVLVVPVASDPVMLPLLAIGAAALIGVLWWQEAWQFRPALGGVLAGLLGQWLSSVAEPAAVLALPRGVVACLGAIGAVIMLLSLRVPKTPRRPEVVGHRGLAALTLSPRLTPTPLAAA